MQCAGNFKPKSQIIRKPGSVLADHLSSLNVTIKIKRINDTLWRGTTE